jgi:hypothetical protein
MKYRRLTPVLVAGVLALLAGCNDSPAASDDAPAQAPAPAPVTSAAPSTPAAAPAAPGPIVGLRPLTANERQQRDYCQQGIVKNGCQFYTDDSLRLQGIDPDS